MKKIVLIFLFLFAYNFAQQCTLIPAAQMAALLDKEPISIPDTVSIERVPTLNGMGYIFYHISPLGNQFITNEAKDNSTVLEIGAGFSNVAMQALKQSAVSYVANDLSLEHLKILVARIKAQYSNQAPAMLQQLSLLHAKVPQELPALDNTFDAILLDKVFHFLAPHDSELFIEWAKKALKPQGKLYILTICPFIKTFKDKILPAYRTAQLQGKAYPGYFENLNDYIDAKVYENNPQYKIPQALTFFCRQDLENLFMQKGFAIQESYCVSLPNPSHEKWEIVADDHGDLVAMIAIKN